jgi:DUF438 domain-containing protein
MNADGRDTGGAERTPAETARRLVLGQHRELRRLLAMGLIEARHAESALTHEPLRALVSLIREVFVRHLADEEALIVPILEDDPPVGPQRVVALREEHQRQRAELEALCLWPQEASDAELANRFDGLAKALLEDIAHEERELLIPDVIRDDHVVRDQSDG